MHLVSFVKGLQVPREADVRIRFGKQLRQLRRERGLSQEELALRAGLHRTYVSSTERGERNVALINLQRLAQALGISLSELFRGY